MSWFKWMLIAVGTVVVLVVVIIAALGQFTSGGGKEVRHISVGQRTITVSHYKNMTQESIADGVKIVADGHVITATPETISIDGNPQNLDPSQDVEISIDQKGVVQAKALSPEAPAPDSGNPEASDEAPPE
jgi:hypothetical protein